MKFLLKIGKAIFNFVVGDWILLMGTLVTFGSIQLIHTVTLLSVLQPWAWLILVTGLVVSLTLTLLRERS